MTKKTHRLRLTDEKAQFLKHAITKELGGHGDSFADLIRLHQQLGKHTQDSGLILSLNAHLWGAVFPLITYSFFLEKAPNHASVIGPF